MDRAALRTLERIIRALDSEECRGERLHFLTRIECTTPDQEVWQLVSLKRFHVGSRGISAKSA